MDRFSRENSCTICHDYGSSECGCPSDAQAKIARLQAELERTNDVLESQAHVIKTLRAQTDDMVTREWAELRFNATHNAAIEEAAALANKSVNEGGLARSMAFFVDVADYKSYKQGVSDYLDAIHSLKRPN